MSSARRNTSRPWLTFVFSLVAACIAATFQLTTLLYENRLKAIEPVAPKETGAESPVQTDPGRDPLGIAEIRFESPAPRAHVSQLIDVKYSVSGKIPPGYRALLVTQDPLGQYWSWGSSPAGVHRRVQMGVAEDVGLEFNIFVLITNEVFPINQPRRSLPSALFRRSISVIRLA